LTKDQHVGCSKVTFRCALRKGTLQDSFTYLADPHPASMASLREWEQIKNLMLCKK